MNVEELAQVKSYSSLPIELQIKRIEHTSTEDWVEAVTFIADALKQYDKNSWEDSQSEIVDGLIPIYYSDKWKEMNDLSLWAVAEIEREAYDLLNGVEDDGDPLFKVINAYLWAYYSRVTCIVLAYLQDQGEEEEGDE